MNRTIADCGSRIANHEKRRCFGLNPQSAIHDQHSNGFTLIEVLLALAIFAGVVTVLYGVFSTTGIAVEQADRVREGGDAVRTLAGRLTNDIANAFLDRNMPATFFYGRKAEEESGDRKTRFDGIFLTTLTNWRRPDSREMALWELGYYFKDRPEGKGRVLVRREKREFNEETPPLEGGVEYELTDQVESLRLRYWSGGSWSDEWDSRQRAVLPRAVEIVLVMAGGGVYATSVDIRGQ